MNYFPARRREHPHSHWPSCNWGVTEPARQGRDLCSEQGIWAPDQATPAFYIRNCSNQSGCVPAVSRDRYGEEQSPREERENTFGTTSPRYMRQHAMCPSRHTRNFDQGINRLSKMSTLSMVNAVAIHWIHSISTMSWEVRRGSVRDAGRTSPSVLFLSSNDPPRTRYPPNKEFAGPTLSHL